MGWSKSVVQGTAAVEHNGVLSTFHADAVLLPGGGYGFVLLYNACGLTAAMLANPEIKNGLVMTLTGRMPESGGLSLPWLGRGLAALSALIVALALWSLLRLRQWKRPAVDAPRWKVGWGVLWPVAPAWAFALRICAALGLLNSVIRLVSRPA